jgi:hypothetical protein
MKGSCRGKNTEKETVSHFDPKRKEKLHIYVIYAASMYVWMAQ